MCRAKESLQEGKRNIGFAFCDERTREIYCRWFWSRLWMLWLGLGVTKLGFRHGYMEIHSEWWDTEHVVSEGCRGGSSGKGARKAAGRAFWRQCPVLLTSCSSDQWSCPGCTSNVPDCRSSPHMKAEEAVPSPQGHDEKLNCWRKKLQRQNFPSRFQTISSSPRGVGMLKHTKPGRKSGQTSPWAEVEREASIQGGSAAGLPGGYPAEAEPKGGQPVLLAV